MRFGRLLSALSVFVAASALIVLTGTGAAATQPGRSAPAATTANLSAPAALDAYLRSVGVSRASLVVQRGARNYAGPNCPGKGWNCTTSKRVLQIAKSDGQNKVDCTSGSIVTGSSQSCTIVQSGANNSAKCQQRSSSDAAVQYCKITQTGTNNRAQVHQTVHAENSAEQTATQTAIVNQTQTSGGGLNESNVYQDVNQKAKEGTAQSQDVQQSADVDQLATGAGTNTSKVHQSQHLLANGSATSQSQNTDAPRVPDCAPGGHFLAPSAPNACANIYQKAVDGDNDSRIKQSIKEDAKSHVSATQQQGVDGDLDGVADGGIEAVVHQELPLNSTGSSKNEAKQSKRQDLKAPFGSTQTQWDPIRCCGVTSQIGGTGNSEQVDQSSAQAASEELAFQQLALIGESRSPTGSCSVSQNAKNNSDSTTNSDSLDPCDPFLVLVTTCTSGGFTTDGPLYLAAKPGGLGSCTAFPSDTGGGDIIG